MGFHGEALLAPRRTPQLEGPPLVSCPRLLIYNHNWRNISTIYIYNKTSIKRNILTIK